MFSGADAPWHWLIVVIVAVVLFGGYKKLPEAARSLGRSLRIFKTEIKGMNEDDAARAASKAEIVPPTASSGSEGAAQASTHTEANPDVPVAPPAQSAPTSKAFE